MRVSHSVGNHNLSAISELINKNNFLGKSTVNTLIVKDTTKNIYNINSRNIIQHIPTIKVPRYIEEKLGKPLYTKGVYIIEQINITGSIEDTLDQYRGINESEFTNEMQNVYYALEDSTPEAKTLFIYTFISEQDIQEKGSIYVRETNVTLAMDRGKYRHPLAVRTSIDNIISNEDGIAINITIIEEHEREYYTNVANTVIRINSTKNSLRDNGIYLTISKHGAEIYESSRSMTMDELLGTWLFKTIDECKANMNIDDLSTFRKMSLDTKKTNLDIVKVLMEENGLDNGVLKSMTSNVASHAKMEEASMRRANDSMMSMLSSIKKI